jgi:hypothetical protein
MGLILSDNGYLPYFSDIQHTSPDTPTLSALSASWEPDTQSLPYLPALLVARPCSYPGAWPYAQVIHDLELQVTSLNPGNHVVHSRA